jgi:hypothetical protein
VRHRRFHLPEPRQLLREALALGFTLRPGSRHWHASHPSGGRAIVPYGRKASDRSQRNIRASLRRAARGVAT